MRLIERASTDDKFDVAKLQALLDVRERWNKEEARKAFVVALTNFKADPPEVLKTKHVSYPCSGGRTEYNHAVLSDASAQIGAALSSHGLSHRWNVEQTKEGRIAVTCVLMHVMGHSESVRMESSPDQSGGKNSIQAIGSATSYLQRYTLFAAAGVIAKEQEDDDGETESKAELPKRKSEKAAETAPAAEAETGEKEKTSGPSQRDIIVASLATTNMDGKQVTVIREEGAKPAKYYTDDSALIESAKKAKGSMDSIKALVEEREHAGVKYLWATGVKA